MGNLYKYIVVMAAGLMPLAAGAAEPVPGASYAGLLDWLQAHNPELQAARLESDAAAQQAEAAGALPDPSVRIEWRDVNQAGGTTLDPNRVGGMKYTVLQPIPGWGKRSAQRQVAGASAEMAQAQARAVEAELRARLRLVFAQYYRAAQALQLNGELTNFAVSTAQQAQARYENGLASQGEWTKARLEQSALENERFGLEAEQRRVQARLNALLNRDSLAPLAEPQALPDLPAPLPDEVELQRRLQAGNPQLQGQVAQSAAAAGEADLAKRNLTPDFILAAGPTQARNGGRNWDAMLEFTVPLQFGAHHAHRHEAENRLEASRAREQALAQELRAQLSEHAAAARAAEGQLQLARKQTLPLAELAFKSVLLNYQNGRADYAALWMARRELQQARLNALDAQVAQQMHWAEIERLTGETR